MSQTGRRRRFSVRRSVGLGVHTGIANCLLAMTVGLLLSGCGSSTSSTPQESGFKFEKVDVAKLPAVNDPLPPLDDGRLEIAMPEKWKVGGRTKGLLASAFMRSGQAYPQILVRAGPAEYDVQTLTPEELQGFESQVQEELNSELKEKGLQPTVKVQAIQVGDFLGVQYIRRTKNDAGQSIDRLILETTNSGRRYQIEMRAIVGTTLETRPFVLGVANSAKFMAAPADGTPAESKPE